MSAPPLGTHLAFQRQSQNLTSMPFAFEIGERETPDSKKQSVPLAKHGWFVSSFVVKEEFGSFIKKKTITKTYSC